MTLTVHVVLLALAVLMFVLTACGVTAKKNLEAVGLALFAAAFLVR